MSPQDRERIEESAAKDAFARGEVHRKASLAAELSGKSLNQSAEEVLSRATE